MSREVSADQLTATFTGEEQIRAQINDRVVWIKLSDLLRVGITGSVDADGVGESVALVAGSATATDANGGDINLTPGTENGSGIPGHIIVTTGLPAANDDAAAATAGVPVGGLYRTASAIKIRVA